MKLFIELFFTVLLCAGLLAIIAVSFILDSIKYKEKMAKKYVFYEFKDGTELLSRSLDENQLQEELENHGELIKIVKDEELYNK